MGRNYSRSRGRKPHRAFSFESLEPRTMMSANSIIKVQGPLAPPTGPDATPMVIASPVLGGLMTTSTGPFTPAQIHSIYGFDKLSLDGAGTTIAIVDADDDPTLIQDLHVFDQEFGLPDPSVRIAQQTDGSGNPPRPNTKWSTEISLDVEWAHAMAPGANILLCEAHDSSTDNLMAMVDFARNYPGVSVVSMSIGIREFEQTGDISTWLEENQTDFDSNVFITPYGHRPVSFVASAGDSGQVIEYPSSSPNVLAVGGTVITAYQSLTNVGNTTNPGSPTGGTISATPFVASSGPSDFQPMSYDTESAWNHGGGGFSAIESRPAYQNGFNSSKMRSVPDVAYGATGYWIFDSSGGGWETVSGTSAGAPQWAALIALANQGRAQLGGDTLANTMYDIYRLPATDFHDITTGSNGLYQATVGFDQTTGRGTPIANLLVNDLIHSEYLPPPPTINPLGGIVVKGGTTAANEAMVANVTTKPTTTSGAIRVAGVAAIANSPFVLRVGHSARATSLRASDAADQLTDALLGLDERLS
jgi:subtilase family serine protease